MKKVYINNKIKLKNLKKVKFFKLFQFFLIKKLIYKFKLSKT